MFRRLEAAFAAIAVLAGLGSVGLAVYDSRHPELVAQPLPSTDVVVSAPPVATPTPVEATPTPSPTPLPASLFIQHVPYTVQAPYGNWDSAHEEYCEAAAILMVNRFYKGQVYANDRIPPAEADTAMGQIVQVERQTYPGVLDLSLDRVAAIGKALYNYDSQLQPATLDNVKAALAAGKPVLIPVNTHGAPGGQKIAPYYGSPGVYHVIVLIGYDGSTVYANDSGISQGQRYAYAWSLMESAMDAQATLTKPQSQGRVMLTFAPAG
jgi:Peptidase_C39 like family